MRTILPLLVCAAAAWAENGAAVRRETFEIVWTAVRDRHFDPTLGGLDWDAVKRRYAPRVEATRGDPELHAILQEMLGELKQSHFLIIPPEAALPPEAGGGGAGTAGLGVRILEDAAVIDRVKPGSSAGRAGLRTGFLVLTIGGASAADLIAQARRSGEREPVQRMRAERALLGLLDGAPGSSVRVRFQDGAGKVSEAEIERVERGGELTPELANIPPQHLEFESKRIGEAGYVRFNWFLMPLMDRVGPAIRELHDTRGLVIDLRGNAGGLGILAAGIAGLLEADEGSLGVMRMRSGHMNLAVFPQGQPYRGAVAILIDHGSASTSEILAAGLQEHGRAVVVGERSAGAALSSFIQKLPTGAFFQFAIADFQTPKGVTIEGRGVIPDIDVRPGRDSLLAGRDAPLERALQYIERSGRNAQ